MKIKLYTTFLFTFFYTIVTAQNIPLKIILKSTTNDSIINASILLYSLPDTLLLQSKISNPYGNVFSVKQFTKYYIKVSAVAFENKNNIVVVTNQATITTIELISKKNTLDNVVVVTKKSFIKQEDDKTIVDAEVLANSSTNAYEVLEKTPGAVVDQDGNVYLNSSAPATIYINGREMKMSAEDIASLLKSLPAGSVSKIEIMHTPSAKYDAANSGGIVNVVLKKGVKIGTTASINVRYDQGVYNTLSAGFNINKTIGKVNGYLSYQYTHRNYYEDIASKRLIDIDTLLTQKSATTFSPITNYVSGGIDYAFNKNFSIAYDLRLTANNNNSTALSTNDFNNTTTQNEFYKSQTPIYNNGNTLFIGNTITAKYKIDTLGSVWDNEMDYTYNTTNNLQGYTTTYIQPALPAVTGNGTTTNTSNNIDFKSDLSLKLKHFFMLETGVKISTALNKNNAIYFTQTGSAAQQPNPYQTNKFTYKENINAAYVQLSKTYHKIIFKAGLRYENTNITGTQIVPMALVFYINRNDVFPYFYIKRNLFKIFGFPLTGNIIYRKSITRPGYNELNPSPKYIDPFTYNVGNINLQPQFTTNYEVNVSYNDFPVFAIGENITKDIFSQVTYQNNTTKIASRTYDNLGKNKEIYARLFGGLPPGGKYFMYAGVQYNYILFNGHYQGLPLNYNRGSWTFFMGQELKINPTLRLDLNGWMYVNGFRQFNELKTIGQLNMSITKTMFNNKLSIILSGNDILRTNKVAFHLQQGDVLVDGTRTQDSRRFGATIRYNIGVSPKLEKKENTTQSPVNTEGN